MLCYIVRHAIAFERDRERWPDDDLRPLAPAGEREFRMVAAGLAHLVGPVARVLTSPLARARETAAILRAVAGWPEAIETAELAPGHSPRRTLAAVRRHIKRESRGSGREVEGIALVGHEPHLTELIAASVAGPRLEVRSRLQKGGAACLEFEHAARPGRGELLWLLTPEVLCALAERAPRRRVGPRGRTHRRR
jgi:phosphohistidine phosphatase